MRRRVREHRARRLVCPEPQPLAYIPVGRVQLIAPTPRHIPIGPFVPMLAVFGPLLLFVFLWWGATGAHSEASLCPPKGQYGGCYPLYCYTPTLRPGQTPVPTPIPYDYRTPVPLRC